MRPARALLDPLRRVATRRKAPRAEHTGQDAIATLQLELARRGPAPLFTRTAVAAEALHVATIIPSFRRGSGGHATIAHLLEALRASGHRVSVWLEDCAGRHAEESQHALAKSFREFFSAPSLELRRDFSSWQGADVVLATGWQTVPRALLLPGAAARAYLVQDHEPDFYGASAEALWAAASYRHGLHCIAASPWLAALLRDRYGAPACHFDLAPDHSRYRPAPEPPQEERESVAFYARALTPRRAVPLGLLALAELKRRRPSVELLLFGEDRSLPVAFEHRNLGVLDAAELAQLYRRVSVGLVLSLTNPSLICLEMMACGLPCVELASESMLATFAAAGQPTLAAAEPLALCAAIEALLEQPARRERARRAGPELVAERTWERAARQVHDGLLEALASAASASAGAAIRGESRADGDPPEPAPRRQTSPRGAAPSRTTHGNEQHG